MINKKNIIAIQDRIKKYSQQSKELNDQLVNLENEVNLLIDYINDIEENETKTISYKLGKSILEMKTFKGFISFPKKLFIIRKKWNELEKNRKVKNNTVTIPVKNTEILMQKPKSDNPKNLSLHKKPQVLSVLDPFSYANFEKLFLLNYLIFESKNQIENTKANFFLIESAWRGFNKIWDYALISNDFKHTAAQKLRDTILRLKEKNIPIVFLYRENKTNLDKFNSIAKLSNYIFVTDKDAVDKLKVSCPNAKITFFDDFLNEFIANPKVNKNIETNYSLGYIGEYESLYNHDNDFMINKFLPKLNTINGAAYKKKSSNKLGYQSVPEFVEITDDITPEDMVSLIKKNKFTLHLANEKEKRVPRKILESLASGIPVISTPSSYLKEKFPSIIQFINNFDEISSILEDFDGRWKYQRLAHLGYRQALLNFSSQQRKISIISELQDKNVEQYKIPKVSIIMATMRESFIERYVENISRQNYANIELNIVTQKYSKEGIKKLNNLLSKTKNLITYNIIENNTEATLGERLNIAAKNSSGEYLAKFDDDDFYFENYLTDMLLPFSFGNYALVGKAEHFVYLEPLDHLVLTRDGKLAHREAEFVSGATLVIKRSSFNKLNGFSHLNISEDSDLIKRILNNGEKIYSSDPFNFILYRSANVANHTWQAKIEAFSKSCSLVSNGIDTNIVRI